MPQIEVEPGVSVYVQDVGSGRPVVLVAGFGLSHEVWDNEVRELAAGHRVVCVDLRGTGRSDKPIGNYTIARLAADLEVVLASLDLRDVTLVGWSFGGQIGFHLAATAPERLAQLVLVCSNGVRASRSDEFPFGAPPEALLTALVGGERRNRIAARYTTIASGFHGEPDPRVVDFLVRVQLQMPSWAAVACYDSYLRTDLVAELPRVSLPVLQILGSDDSVTPLEGAAWLQQRLADGRLVTLAGCGHYPMFEAPNEFAAALVEFAADRIQTPIAASES
jgi:pimeloyl-ACP methyl ester carboxylesterase